MAAGTYTFKIERGSTVDFEIQYKDSGSNPVDLSDYVAEMRLRNTHNSSTAISELTSSADPINLVYNNNPIPYVKHSGSAFLSISGSDLSTPVASGSIGVYIGWGLTDEFSFSDAVYDIELTKGASRTRILQGKVRLSKDVT